MMINKRDKKTAAQFLLLSAIIIAVIFWGKECSEGALRGIYFCANVLVPSIFPFMVISVFTAKSGLSEKVGTLASGITKKLFGVSGNLSAVILISMIGGYPIGARGIAALKESGAVSESDAVKASYFAVGAGPGFLITFVGGKLLSSNEIGICMLISQVLSVVITGIIIKHIFAGKENYNSDKEIRSSPLPFSSAVTDSVISAVYGTIEMCGMVVIFSALLGITESLSEKYNVYASVLLEVTSACSKLSESGNVIIMAFAAGFGGLCVHFQIFSALKNIAVNKTLFFLFRIIQGVIVAFFTWVLIKILNISLPVFSSVGFQPELSISSSAVGSVLLIICGISFLYSIKKL